MLYPLILSGPPPPLLPPKVVLVDNDIVFGDFLIAARGILLLYRRWRILAGSATLDFGVGCRGIVVKRRVGALCYHRVAGGGG